MLSRSSGLTVLLIAMLAVAIVAPFPAHAHNLNITDYDTTVSGAKESRIYFNYSKDTSLDYDKHATNYRISEGYSLLHSEFYDSLDKSWDLSLTASYSDLSSWTTGSESKDISHHYSANCNYNIYFLPQNSVYNGIKVNYAISNNSDENGPVGETYLTLGNYHIGIGHVIDVTPLAEAGVLEDRLMDSGALKERFSKEEMLKMAEIIRKYRMGEYSYYNSDTGKGRFLDDLIKVINASGKLTRPLDGFSFWRISENRFVTYTRRKGCQAEVGVNRSGYININRSVDPSYTTNLPVEYTSMLLTGYLPLDWRSQVSFASEYDLVTNYPDDGLKEFSTASLSYTYDLTNYIWCVLEGMITRYNYPSLSQSDNASYKDLYAEINFKIEDNWIVSLSFERESMDSGPAYNLFMASGTIYFWN